MKRLFFLIIICLFVVSCGKQADNTVEKFIDNIKNKKIDAAMKYVKDEDIAKNVEIMEISYKNKTQEAIFEALFKNMNYKVLQTKKETDEKTIVKVEIENVDVKGVFTRLFEETMNDLGFDGDSKADDHSSLEKKLITILNDKNVPKTKSTTEFIVYKTKDGNKIELTPDNVNVMFGQIYTSIERFEKSGETSEEKKPESEDIQPKPQPMQKK